MASLPTPTLPAIVIPAGAAADPEAVDNVYLDLRHGLMVYRDWLREAALRAYAELGLDPGLDRFADEMTAEQRVAELAEATTAAFEEHLADPVWDRLRELQRQSREAAARAQDAPSP